MGSLNCRESKFRLDDKEVCLCDCSIPICKRGLDPDIPSEIIGSPPPSSRSCYRVADGTIPTLNNASFDDVYLEANLLKLHDEGVDSEKKIRMALRVNSEEKYPKDLVADDFPSSSSDGERSNMSIRSNRSNKSKKRDKFDGYSSPSDGERSNKSTRSNRSNKSKKRDKFDGYSSPSDGEKSNTSNRSNKSMRDKFDGYSSPSDGEKRSKNKEKKNKQKESDTDQKLIEGEKKKKNIKDLKIDIPKNNNNNLIIEASPKQLLKEKEDEILKQERIEKKEKRRKEKKNKKNVKKECIELEDNFSISDESDILLPVSEEEYNSIPSEEFDEIYTANHRLTISDLHRIFEEDEDDVKRENEQPDENALSTGAGVYPNEESDYEDSSSIGLDSGDLSPIAVEIQKILKVETKKKKIRAQQESKIKEEQARKKNIFFRLFSRLKNKDSGSVSTKSTDTGSNEALSMGSIEHDENDVLQGYGVAT